MFAATAPPMEKAFCEKCKISIEDASENDVETNIFKMYRYSVFLNNDKKNSDTLPILCPKCLSESMETRAKKLDQEKLEMAKQKKHNLNIINRSTVLYICGICLVVIIAVLLYFIFNHENKNIINQDMLRSTISQLKNQFPTLQPSLWRKMNGGFERLKTPGEPFVLLLLHDDTNKKTTDCLASYLSNVAKKNIFSSTTNGVWMNASEWTTYSSHDDANLINEKLSPLLKKHEVLVLENLQDLPWSLAKPFHFFCDTFNPQIKKALYILELRVDSLLQLTENAAEHDKLVVAERAMEIAWLDAPSEFRNPLITRLTSYVDAVLLKTEEECSDKIQIWSEIFLPFLP